MTEPLPLSARIAALEARVQRGRESAVLHDGTLRRRAALDLELDEFAAEMEDGAVAEGLLVQLVTTLDHAEAATAPHPPVVTPLPELTPVKVNPVPVLAEGGGLPPVPTGEADDGCPQVAQAASEPPAEMSADKGAPETAPAVRPTALILATAWAQSLTPGHEFGVDDLRAAVGCSASRASITLGRLRDAGLITLVSGAGRTGTPGRYVRQAGEVTPLPTEPADATRSARIRAVLERDPTQPWTVSALAVELDLDHEAIWNVIRNFQTRKVTEAVPGSHPKQFCLFGHAPAPAGVPTLPPIPERLTTDEVSVFDALRHAPGGLTRRVLQAQLNLSTARLDRAASSLLRAGHIAGVLDVLRVPAVDAPAAVA